MTTTERAKEAARDLWAAQPDYSGVAVYREPSPYIVLYHDATPSRTPWVPDSHFRGFPVYARRTGEIPPHKDADA